MTVATEEMKKYEIMLLLNPELTDDQLKNALDKIREQIEKNAKAIVLVEQSIGKRPLAYRIKLREFGIYHLFVINAQSENIHEIEDFLRLDIDVLRSLLIKVPENYQPLISFEERTEEERRRPRGKMTQLSEEIIQTTLPKQEVRKEETQPKEKMTHPKKQEKPVTESKESPDDDLLSQKIDEILKGEDLI